MLDQVIGPCCAIVATACIDVLAGICVDFTSVRHACTENLCRCSCLRRHTSDAPIDDLEDERDPLLSHTQQQPTAHPPMRNTRRSSY
ncbi:hypothetical protein V8E55_010420 [Tylopilus felleus]